MQVIAICDEGDDTFHVMETMPGRIILVLEHQELAALNATGMLEVMPPEDESPINKQWLILVASQDELDQINLRLLGSMADVIYTPAQPSLAPREPSHEERSNGAGT